MSTVNSDLNLLSFKNKTRILHLSWFAFFLTFVVWFNHAPLLATITGEGMLLIPDSEK